MWRRRRLDAWHLRCRNRHGVYGTGNPGKDFDVSDRKGGNLYTDSVALDDLEMISAEIVNDIWDYDAPYERTLFRKDGKDRIVHMNKSGYVFVLDKEHGQHREHLADKRPEEPRQRRRPQDRPAARTRRADNEQGDADLPLHVRCG